MKAANIRVTTYQEIIDQAEEQYKNYLDAQKYASNKIRMIEDILSSIDV